MIRLFALFYIEDVSNGNKIFLWLHITVHVFDLSLHIHDEYTDISYIIIDQTYERTVGVVVSVLKVICQLFE